MSSALDDCINYQWMDVYHAFKNCHKIGQSLTFRQPESSWILRMGSFRYSLTCGFLLLHHPNSLHHFCNRLKVQLAPIIGHNDRLHLATVCKILLFSVSCHVKTIYNWPVPLDLTLIPCYTSLWMKKFQGRADIMLAFCSIHQKCANYSIIWVYFSRNFSC